MTDRFVVVTTNSTRRGVFAGVLESHDPDKGLAVLTEARMAVYWDRETRGVVGLAATGPTPGCRITRAAPRLELDGVTSVMDATPEAAAAWRSEPWN